jgi:hypothetical protein
LPPYIVLHVDLMASDPVKIMEAIKSTDNAPKAVVFPVKADTRKLLKECGLWTLKE